MSVWLTIPSKRPVEEVEPVLKAWRERGYRVAIWADGAANFTEWNEHGVNLRVQQLHYPGYAVACNTLIGLVMQERPDTEWFICGGDDVLPDPNHSADEIAEQCKTHFWSASVRRGEQRSCEHFHDTFGVMQPTGDRWGYDHNGHAFEPQTPGCDSCNCKCCNQREDSPNHLVGAYIDRVAGSPWIGREFARRMYQGKGPYWPEYTHMGVDEELQAVATKLGVFWQRPDLTHFHQHWGRPRDGEVIGQTSRMPAFLEKANSAPEWARYKRIFAERKAAGFPGSEPL